MSELNAKEYEKVMYHETGHLLFALKDEYVDKATIFISFNNKYGSLGATTHSKLLKEFDGIQNFHLIFNAIKGKVAGNIAEEVFLGGANINNSYDDYRTLYEQEKVWIEKHFPTYRFDDVLNNAIIEVRNYFENNKDEFFKLLNEVKQGKWCKNFSLYVGRNKLY